MTTSGTHVKASAEIRALTGLRIVAALWVVLIHFQTEISNVLGGYIAPLWPVVMSGWMGVDLFFLLSGFVMTVSYLDRLGRRWDTRGAIVFLWARLIRIWPMWALLTTGMFGFLLLTGWDSGPAAEYHRQPTLTALLEQLGLAQMWHRDLNLGSSFVPPGWSLSVELLAYLCFPLLILVVFRLRRLPAVVLAVLAVGAMVPLALLVLRTGQADFWLPWPLRIAGSFLSGSLTCLFVNRVRDSAAVRKASPFIAAMCVAEVVVVCYWAYNRLLQGQQNEFGLAVVFFPVLVGALALSDRGIAAFLSRETLVVGGRISFALYLVHTMFLDVAHYLQVRVPALGPATSLGMFMEIQLIPAALLASWLLWRFVEEPARSWLRLRGPGRLARHTPARTGAPVADPAADLSSAALTPAPALRPVPLVASRQSVEQLRGPLAVPVPVSVRSVATGRAGVAVHLASAGGRLGVVAARTSRHGADVSPVAVAEPATARMAVTPEPSHRPGRPPVPREGTEDELLRV